MSQITSDLPAVFILAAIVYWIAYVLLEEKP